ncbi:MAG: hypothetical protein ACI4RA_11360 [Kiritimatiellia bacterium]
MKACVSLLMACGSVMCLFAAGDVVVNGGFNDVADGRTVAWNEVKPRYVYRDGEGRSGTRALCFENDDPKFYSFPGQKLDLKPGHFYEYEVWVKTENLKGDESGATICIEWSDANGKWLGGAYADGVKGTKDWTCVKGLTEAIPAAARSFRVHPYVRKGMTGRAWFDDVSVREHVPRPLEGLYSTAYRDLAADGVVTFRAAAPLSPAFRERGVTARFRYTDAGGVRRMVTASSAEAPELTLDVASLKMGRQSISVDLVASDGVVVATAERAFTRVERLPARAAWIDAHGRTILHGQPFFPLGMYWSGITSNKVDLYAQGPFNCLMPYNSPSGRELMDYCHAKGLKVIYSVKDVYSGTRWAPNGIATEADEVRYITDRVTRFKDHPALLAWYLNDELPLTMRDRLAARRDLMEKLDPGHPGWAVLYQYTQIRGYLPTFDVIGTDPYPIPGKPALMASVWTRSTQKGTMGCKPLWQVPQAFNWAAYRKTPEERAKFRAPTEAELRSMCWQCIANGANGLVLYSFFDLEKRPNDEPFERRWAECCRVGAEIRAQFPVLLSVEGASRPLIRSVEMSRPPANPDDAVPVSARAWMKDGKVYVLVVNGGGEPQEVRVGLEGVCGGAVPVFGPKPGLATQDGSSTLSVTLAPLEPALLCADVTSW